MGNSSHSVILLKGAAMLADEEEDDEVGEVLTLPLQAHHAMEKMEEFVHKVTLLCCVRVVLRNSEKVPTHVRRTWNSGLEFDLTS